jgi:hypothetical protein
MLLKNHLITGVCALVESSGLYSSVVKGRGSQLSGNLIASKRVLKDVKAIQTSGATNIVVKMSSVSANGSRRSRFATVPRRVAGG